MNMYWVNLRARRAKTQRQMDELAHHVSEGMSVTAAGRVIGLGQQRSSQLWRKIRDGLGAQAQ